MHLHQINLQPSVGGGEVYTRSFTRALVQAGARVTLYVDKANRFWDSLPAAQVEVVRVSDPQQIVDRLPKQGALLVTQSRIPASLFELAAGRHTLTGFAHMPMLGRSAAEFSRYSTVFTVSNYCIGLLREAGVSQVYPEPLYGTCELEGGSPSLSEANSSIQARSPYHWDTRKGRDRLLSVLEPVARSIQAPRTFSKKPGLTLGIVSLLSPIKQFPLLFAHLAPRIARFPQVQIEIFGNGGYAQVRDIRESLSPMGDRVRFWGYQREVACVYPQLDYLMTGLADKEALGLNVLEAQAAGTPVLAPRAPPFTETMVHGASGFLYRDPREDGGGEFESVLSGVIEGRLKPDLNAAAVHLEKFSFAAMTRRLHGVLEHLARYERAGTAHGR
jgi:glycosyltransferase involved in cell wall biosynthesis